MHGYLDIYTNSQLPVWVPPVGWRWLLWKLTTIHLNPKRMVVYIHPNTLITHPDNLTELKQHLTDEGYIFRVTAPAKPHLKVVKNDREEDRQ